MQEYKESMRLLNFTSKGELILQIKKLLEIIKESKNNILHNVESDLINHLKLIRDASLETITNKSEAIEFNPKGTRRQFHDVSSTF